MNQLLAQTVGVFENVNIKDKETAVWEILIMLTGAFLLGYLLHWLLSRSVKRVETPAKVASVATPAVASRRATPDDLTMIEGIGPKINELLQAGGIRTFGDLSKANPAHIRSILDEAGPRFRMHDPSSWGKQGALAAAGRMDELKVLQDRLSGGK